MQRSRVPYFTLQCLHMVLARTSNIIEKIQDSVCRAYPVFCPLSPVLQYRPDENLPLARYQASTAHGFLVLAR